MKENLKTFKKKTYCLISKYNISLSDKEKKKIDALINMAYVLGGKSKRDAFLTNLENNLKNIENKGDVSNA